MFVNRKSLYTTGICSRCGRVQFLAFRDDKFAIDHWSPLSHRGCDPATIPLHAMFDYISMLVRTFTLRNFKYETGRLYCPQSVRYPNAIVQRILSSGIFFWLGFRDRIAMLMPGKVADRTLGLRGPELACGPEFARPCATPTESD